MGVVVVVFFVVVLEDVVFVKGCHVVVVLVEFGVDGVALFVVVVVFVDQVVFVVGFVFF